MTTVFLELTKALPGYANNNQTYIYRQWLHEWHFVNICVLAPLGAEGATRHASDRVAVAALGLAGE